MPWRGRMPHHEPRIALEIAGDASPCGLLTRWSFDRGMVLRMSDSIGRLFDAVVAARHADPATSRTARLLRSGRAKMAKKLAEEAVEVVIDAMMGNRAAVVSESADLLYNLVVLWASSGVHPDDVWKEMERRARLFGIAEKLRKDGTDSEPRRKVIALEARRLHKRR